MKELTCIICPRGCHLLVDENLNVTGNNCPRGEIYAKNELTNPTRTVTSTVKINSKVARRLPVKTNKAISKKLIFKCMEEINQTLVNAPIKIGDTIIKGVAGSDVDIIATKDIFE